MDTVEWLTQLIRFNTVSSNTNIPLIKAIDEWFKLNQIESHIIIGPTEDKANLFATIPAITGETNGGLLLSGHTDVVPVIGQKWDSDPFIAREHEGKIYGRGTSDMKGFVAVLLALLPDLKKLKLIKPVHFAFTSDEEIGCFGADCLVEFLQKAKIHPEGCIIGEPSSMQPIVGEKARRLYQCTVKGKAVHSSLASQGCNAIEYASRLIGYISTLARYTRDQGPFDEDFDVPFTTITTNLIHGGNAANIIPDTCQFIMELRYIKQFPVEDFSNQIKNYIDTELLPEMQENCPRAEIDIELIADAPGFNASENAAITRIVRAVTGVKKQAKVSYATESGIFQRMGIPSLICGPGDIEQAHTPNEFITIEQLHHCEKVLQNIIHLFCVDQGGKIN